MKIFDIGKPRITNIDIPRLSRKKQGRSQLSVNCKLFVVCTWTIPILVLVSFLSTGKETGKHRNLSHLCQTGQPTFIQGPAIFDSCFCSLGVLTYIPDASMGRGGNQTKHRILNQTHVCNIMISSSNYSAASHSSPKYLLRAAYPARLPKNSLNFSQPGSRNTLYTSRTSHSNPSISKVN